MDPRLNLIIEAQDRASRVLDKTSRSTGGLRSELSALKGPALAAGAAIGALAVSSVMAASDLEESINAVNVVFGQGAGNILRFGEEAAQTVGLSNAAFNELATETGALLINFGQTQEQASEQTVLLATRAADLASVFNTDVSEAMDAINQALRGETEAIRRFGGDVTDATLQNYLLAQGIDQTVQSMSQAEKANLRLTVLMEQTNIVAGDFANTSDSLANTQRQLTSEWENLRAELGEKLIPVLSDTLTAINNVVSGEAGLLEQSLEDGLLGWIVRIGDESRFRTTPIINEELVPAINSATSQSDEWSVTLETINRLNNEKTAALEKAAAALKADTEATIEHNKQSRADGMAIADLTRETYSFETAMGVAEAGIRQVNAALRRQEQQARETSAAFREYQALVTRTLEGRRGLREAQAFLENTPLPAAGPERSGPQLVTSRAATRRSRKRSTSWSMVRNCKPPCTKAHKSTRR